jgi:pilus assembly protein CpaF
LDFLHINTVIIALLTVFAFTTIFFIFKKDMEPDEENVEINMFSLQHLEKGVKDLFNDIINQNIAELYLNRKETKKREHQKARICIAIRSCAQGNIGEKEFVKDYMKDLLQNNLQINEESINKVIPFDYPDYLTAQDKFEILYQQLSRSNRLKVFDRMNALFGFDKERKNEFGTYYEITEEDIHKAYEQYAEPLSYIDRLEVVTQRIYQELYGFSVADILRDDMTIDGISGGCSGASTEQYNFMEEAFESEGRINTRYYNSLWIFYHGKAIHLSFLSFQSQNDLIRTCKNLYRYDNVGHLTSSNGYKLTYQFDGSRVLVVRPKLASHWAFFVRKFDSTKHMTMDRLLYHNGNERVIELMKWVVKGCLNAILSGDQNSGKTTCLKALGIFIDPRNPIRTTEPEFELWFNNVYDNLNCVCFRGSDEVSLIDSINIQKKSDAAIMILGEVNNSELAAAYISLCQSGTKSTLCTCHCISTEDAVDYFRNSIMSVGIFRNEMIAEEQVANSIYIDIHWEKSSDGYRYIRYINEIIPYQRNEVVDTKEPLDSIAQSLQALSRKRAFSVRELIALENGEYIVKNRLSERSVNRILRNITQEERNQFLMYYDALEEANEC